MPTAQEYSEDVNALLKQSEFLKAYDLASTALVDHPDDRRLQHRSVLALARAGALDRAQARFVKLGLDRVHDDEEILALAARLQKDQAFAMPYGQRGAKLAQAALAYERAYDAGGGGYFPAINVASMHALAGAQDEAEHWAAVADKSAESDPSYYGLATRAEAAAIRGDSDALSVHLANAMRVVNEDFAAMRTTRQQLDRLLREKGLDSKSLLAELAPPKVVHFCGHLVAPAGSSGRFPAQETPRVKAEIAALLAAQNVGFGVGSLAAGADILIAEALLDAGGAFDAILPFQREEFVDVSVRSCGEEWVPRFEACLAAARSVTYVTEDAYLGDDDLFNYASHLGMGLARLRSERLGAELGQLAVWDGAGPLPGAAAGTVFDLMRGRAMQLDQWIVPSQAGLKPCISDIHDTAEVEAGGRRRRTMIFGDFKGFSRLGDAQLPIYVEQVLGACAAVLKRHGKHLVFRNTWGDGLFQVYDDVAVAAEAALELCQALASLDLKALGLPETMGIRLGMHYGPVYEQVDPVLACPNVFGFHVSKAARIEPITPEGEIYVTDAAAAALAVEAPEAYRCDYVGKVPLAKGYGEFPMYALERRS